MIADILGEGLIAQHETESPLRIHIDRLLQIQFLEGNHLLRGFCSLLFVHHEMELTVDKPVVGDVENSAIVQKQLREFPRFCAVDIDGFGSGRKIVRGIPGRNRRSIV